MPSTCSRDSWRTALPIASGVVSARFRVETEYPSSRAASSMPAMDEVGPNSPIVADRMPSMFDLLVTRARAARFGR